ncbi:sodium channel protein Nach [Drosophila sulfurigaster albostrigata]|uniref:sodium channel protein Nach n=1 Tax=Drosophila sulfurigaster albostrigata TaxID=89887 RepID=UPI002D2199F3|nr:sodium channel protein Nach [Drosophila sulfurigaster albostrigata]
MVQLAEGESESRRLFRDFLRNSYISGLQPFLFETSVRYAKALWLTFLAVIVVSTHIVIVNLTLEYIVQPTEIHMSPNQVHVANSPFPAVAICSSNMISKRQMQTYAAKIYLHQSTHNPQPSGNSSFYSPIESPQLDVLARRLLLLANFYLHAHEESQLDVDELGQLHRLLSSYHNGRDYSVHDILRELSPDCGDLVLRGIIYGAPVNTSQLFIKRTTSSGVCCIFNYRRPSDSQYPWKRALEDAELYALPHVMFESNSILNGIQFVLQDTTKDDYTMTYFSNTAFRLQLFPKDDYATIQSNTNGAILVDHETIVEIPIQPKFFDSSAAVRGVTPETRRCYFSEEGKRILNQSYYSMDECLLRCRIDSMLQHCGCVSSPLAGSAMNITYCTLLDLPCLMKWKRVWFSYTEFPYVHQDNEEVETGIDQCKHCLPTCNGVDFEIVSNVAPLRRTYNSSGYFHGLLKGLTNDRPLSIIKLFFRLRFAQATEMDMVGDWVVLLNRFGGILSLMYGFSIISYIEILYYLTGKWFVYYYRACTNKIKGAKTDANVYTFHWNELQPHAAARSVRKP